MSAHPEPSRAQSLVAICLGLLFSLPALAQEVQVLVRTQPHSTLPSTQGSWLPLGE